MVVIALCSRLIAVTSHALCKGQNRHRGRAITSEPQGMSSLSAFLLAASITCHGFIAAKDTLLCLIREAISTKAPSLLKSYSHGLTVCPRSAGGRGTYPTFSARYRTHQVPRGADTSVWAHTIG